MEPYSLKLECTVSNGSNIFWYHQSKEITKTTVGYTLTSSGDQNKKTYTLIKTNTSAADSGTYKCVLGDKTSSTTFNVEVFKGKYLYLFI